MSGRFGVVILLNYISVHKERYTHGHLKRIIGFNQLSKLHSPTNILESKPHPRYLVALT